MSNRTGVADDQLKTLLAHYNSINNNPRKKINGFAKNLTYVIIITTFLIGIIGSFDVVPFNMESFISFIPMFASLFIPLVLSIGINSAVDKKAKADLEITKCKLETENEGN